MQLLALHNHKRYILIAVQPYASSWSLKSPFNQLFNRKLNLPSNGPLTSPFYPARPACRPTGRSTGVTSLEFCCSVQNGWGVLPWIFFWLVRSRTETSSILVGMDFRGPVWKRVQKITFFGLKSGQDLKNRAAHPQGEFVGEPAPGYFGAASFRRSPLS